MVQQTLDARMVESGGAMLALQRVRASHHLLSLQADDSRMPRPRSEACFASFRLRPSAMSLATAWSCTSELLKVGGPVTLAFLWCHSCLWEIDQAQLD